MSEEPIDVSLIGSTGSIGTQAIDVMAGDPKRFNVVALAANRSINMLCEQAQLLLPTVVALGQEEGIEELKAGVPKGTEILAGPSAIGQAAGLGKVVVNAAVGFAGLPATMAALESGATLALANKESLIAGAPIVEKLRSRRDAQIIPIDSEHSAIYQCLSSGTERARRLLITASGGPFLRWDRDQFANICVEDALKHPTWQMGPKITVDSSTLMNKGLEIIEAHALFGFDYDHIDVVVHPQSIVHSMVEFEDGSTIAQLSKPDMRLAIGYALSWPKRLSRPFGAIDWNEVLNLSFEAPDRSAFRAIDLAYMAGREAKSAPAYLSAANEVAVEAFLAGRIQWLEITRICEEVLSAWPGTDLGCLDDVLAADLDARKLADSAVIALGKVP